METELNVIPFFFLILSFLIGCKPATTTLQWILISLSKGEEGMILEWRKKGFRRGEMRKKKVIIMKRNLQIKLHVHRSSVIVHVMPEGSCVILPSNDDTIDDSRDISDEFLLSFLGERCTFIHLLHHDDKEGENLACKTAITGRMHWNPVLSFLSPREMMMRREKVNKKRGGGFLFQPVYLIAFV